MRPWCFENPTVRSPFRLRDGLIALSKSPLQGHLRGKEKEVEFRNLLGELGIVSLGSDASSSVGRKWRLAMNRRGFLYPDVPTTDYCSQSDIGALDTITPNGWRLIQADSVPGMQECFLRSLAAYYIPSSFENGYDYPAFSPLRHTLAVMLALEKATTENYLSFVEIAAIIQLSSSADMHSDVVARVLELRDRRHSAGRKKQFDAQELVNTSAIHGRKPQTFADYADTNIRYLKATGLVQSKGRGIALVPEKHLFIEKLVEDTQFPDSERAFYTGLCNGADLPTDNKDAALVVLDDLLLQLTKRGIPFDLTDRLLSTPADIGSVRHEIEAILSDLKEEDYAARQAGEWEEISGYMDLLIHRGRGAKTLASGVDIEIPQAEAPAYFEWVLWRAFLAINSLKNKPYDARRFKIDQDFLPVGTAPGNGPDLIFEFDEFVLVVEVTLTDNSRQEAAEGEPVRRHVARIVESHEGKRVYGLFIANKVDTNTVETLRIGFWYKPDDSKMALQIVPITLEQFKHIFCAGFMSGALSPGLIQEFLRDCLAVSNHDAPGWKLEIERTVQEKINFLLK